MFTKEEIEIANPCYEALKKLGWEWEPKEGEWGLTDYGETVLIYKNVDKKSKKNCPLLANTDVYGITSCIGPEYHEVGIPILHWEKIKKILEGLGYFIALSISNYGGEIMVTGTDEYEHDATLFELSYKGNNVQKAVMETVIKLGEEK